MTATAPDTYSLYAALAVNRPVKARRYRTSIAESLAGARIHDIERARLTEALRALDDTLGPACETCHRALSDPDSIERGMGSTCAHRAEARAS